MSATTTAARPPRPTRTPKPTRNGPGGPWTNVVTADVQRQYANSSDRGWTAWRRYLGGRKLRPIRKLFAGSGAPMLWALPLDVDLSETRDRIRLVWRLATASAARPASARSAAEGFLARLAPAQSGSNGHVRAAEQNNGAELAALTSDQAVLSLALERIAWCAALPRLATLLDGPLWWSLANHLIALAGEGPPAAADPLVRQLLGAELPLTVAYLLPELDVARRLARPARSDVGRRQRPAR